MAAWGGRCLLAVALAAAWISGAAAAASSSAEQEGGSHKSVKCMPCSRAYIGDAYLDDTLTGQLAQRRDLVEMSDSGELCKGLADGVAVPMLSKLRRQLVGEGSHRRLVYSVDFGGCGGAMVNFLDGYDAHLVIFEELPDGVFADPFELQHFVERKVFVDVDVALFGDTNLELPTALSNRSSVEIHCDLRLIISTNCSLVIDLPLHARYPPLDSNGYATVEFGNPDLLLRYRKKEIRSDSCLWVIKNLIAAPLEKAAWRIPCGDEAYIGFTRTRPGFIFVVEKGVPKEKSFTSSSVHAPEALFVRSCNTPSSCKKVRQPATPTLRSFAVLSCLTVWTCWRKPGDIALSTWLQSTMLIDTESLVVSSQRLIYFGLMGFMASNYY